MDKMRVQNRGWACATMQTAAGGAGPQIAFMDFARASGAILAVFKATRPNGRAPISTKTRSRKPLRPITHKAPTPAACTEGRDTILVTLLRTPYSYDATPPLGPLLPVYKGHNVSVPHRPICAWWYFGVAHSKNRHHKTGACSQSASQPLACCPYLRPTKIAGPSPEPLTLQIAAVNSLRLPGADTSHLATMEDGLVLRVLHGCTHTRHGDIRNEVMALLLARTGTRAPKMLPAVSLQSSHRSYISITRFYFDFYIVQLQEKRGYKYFEETDRLTATGCAIFRRHGYLRTQANGPFPSEAIFVLPGNSERPNLTTPKSTQYMHYASLSG
ncbi:hypothetical protein GGI42DRAFT_102465 [Trichoderma sp. SZMC 28013]